MINETAQAFDEKVLRSKEKEWERQGKTRSQIRKLRWWFKNKEAIQQERRSLKLDKSIKPNPRD